MKPVPDHQNLQALESELTAISDPLNSDQLQQTFKKISKQLKLSSSDIMSRLCFKKSKASLYRDLEFANQALNIYLQHALYRHENPSVAEQHLAGSATDNLAGSRTCLIDED